MNEDNELSLAIGRLNGHSLKPVDKEVASIQYTSSDKTDNDKRVLDTTSSKEVVENPFRGTIFYSTLNLLAFFFRIWKQVQQKKPFLKSYKINGKDYGNLM